MCDVYIVHAFRTTPTRVFPLADGDGSTSSISSISVTLATTSKHQEAWSHVRLLFSPGGAAAGGLEALRCVSVDGWEVTFRGGFGMRGLVRMLFVYWFLRYGSWLFSFLVCGLECLR